MDDQEVARENRRWIRRLGATGPHREAAAEELYAVLLRVARSEARRRAPMLQLNGPELEDIAHQATGDALMAISDRLGSFRGDARFTTWACRFAIFNVTTKMNRHFWQHRDVPYGQDDWSRVPASGAPLEDEILAGDFAAAVTSAIDEHLSHRQREVFVATVLDGTPIDTVARELGSTHNAIQGPLRCTQEAPGGPDRRGLSVTLVVHRTRHPCVVSGAVRTSGLGVGVVR